MADVGIFTKNAGIQAKAGLGANATSKAITWTDVVVPGVEGFICALTKTSWDAAAYAAADAETKYLLADLGENIAALYVANYDWTGYGTRSIWEDTIKVLQQRINEDISVLKELTYVKFLKTGV